MYLIRVLCNFYDDFQFKRQLKREQLEWLKIAKKYDICYDIQYLISEKYIKRKRTVNGDSYKVIIITISIVSIIAYLLTFVKFKFVFICLFNSLINFIIRVEYTLSLFIVQKVESCEFNLPWIICKILYPF